MLLLEPEPTRGDWNLRIGSVPVRVSPFFWLVAVLLGWSSPPPGDPRERLVWFAGLLAWVVAVFVSILVHEFGHVLAFRYFGTHAHVVLYHFGGLAIADFGTGPYGRRRRDDSLAQMVIALAGPMLQLASAAAVILLLLLAGRNVPLHLGFLEPLFEFHAGQGIASDVLRAFVFSYLFVSIFWALFNLLPVYPLDGGKIARELFLLLDARSGARNSLILSLITAIVMAVYGFQRGDPFLGIMFGVMAYSNYVLLQSLSGPGGFGPFRGGRPW